MVVWEWLVLGAVWGGFLGLGFSMILVPAALLGSDFLLSAAPVIMVATAVAALVVSLCALTVGLIWSAPVR